MDKKRDALGLLPVPLWWLGKVVWTLHVVVEKKMRGLKGVRLTGRD